MAKHLLYLAPRARPDLFQPLSAAADDYLFLRLTFDENRAVNPGEVFALLLPTFGQNGSDVGNLFTSRFEDLLADDLGRQCAH